MVSFPILPDRMKQLPAARYPFFCIAALRQNPLTLRDRTLCDCLLLSSLSQLGATNGLATTKMRTNTGCLKQVRMHCISAIMLNKAGTLHQDTCTFLLAKGNTIQRILNPRTNAPLTLDISLCVVAAPFVRNRSLRFDFRSPRRQSIHAISVRY